MHGLAEESICCPYCGEEIDVLIDCSEQQQEYIEDCQVCCRPIRFQVCIGPDDSPEVQVFHENE
jgi:hypothetical protein